MNDITVRTERIADILDALKPLAEKHFREIAHYQDIPLDPDWDFYRTSPHLRCFTAMAGSHLGGYAVFGVGRNKHYMGSLQAVQDVLYLEDGLRGRGFGAELIRASDAQLKSEGVQVVYHHVKLSHPALGEALRAHGYEPVETIWAKRLDRE